MYKKQEASAIRQEFWASLGRYLSPIPSATGHKINWINYKTGVKNIYFKMHADNSEAIIRIEISGDKETQDKFFNLFLSLKKALEKYTVFRLNWQEEKEDAYGKIIACIFCTKEGVNIFKKEDWPALISFFKQNILAFDNFWAEHKEIFEMHS